MTIGDRVESLNEMLTIWSAQKPFLSVRLEHYS